MNSDKYPKNENIETFIIYQTLDLPVNTRFVNHTIVD